MSATESATELPQLTEHDLNIRNFIAGEFHAARSGRTVDNVEPATGQVYTQIPDSDSTDVDAAVEAAAQAFPAWSRTSEQERSAILMRIADLIDANLDRLALAESIDNGKPYSLARSLDIPRAASNFRFFAGAILHSGSSSYQTRQEALNYTVRRPYGVSGLISPWNLPLYLFTWKVAPAIATGNTAVGKPSEVTPLTAYLLGDICNQAGLPPGVLNIVHGTGAQVGAPLVAHDQVPIISFTGGTVTGAAIAASAAPKFKKLSLELGGKNPFIVFDDIDPTRLDGVVETAVRASFANQGQICLCGSRILVHRSLHDEFVSRFSKAVSQRRIGDPLEAGTEHGALVSRDQLEKVQSYVELAQQEGGTIVHGGKAPPAPNERCAHGYFFEPTVIIGLASECRVNQEEIFGPVTSVIPFEDEEEVVAIANSTRYGLAASLWTRDFGRVHRLARQIDAGTLWVNCWMLRDLRVPFGGMKESGVGREGGEHSLEFFTEANNVCIKLEDQ